MKRAPNRMYLKIAIPIIAIRNPAAPMLENIYRIMCVKSHERSSSCNLALRVQAENKKYPGHFSEAV